MYKIIKRYINVKNFQYNHNDKGESIVDNEKF